MNPRFHTAHHFNCGHERTPENTYTLYRFYRKKDNTRSNYANEYCKLCQKERVAAGQRGKREMRVIQ